MPITPTSPLIEKRLMLRPIGAGIQATWVGQTGIGEPFDLPPLFTEEEKADHRWYLEEAIRWYGPGDAARARGVEGRLAEWGEELHEGLRGHADVHPLADLARSPVHAKANRLLTLVSEDASALALPWELVRDEKGPLLLGDVVLRRQLPTSKETTIPHIVLPLRILWIVSRPEDVGFLDPRSSLKPALDALAGLGSAVVVDLCTPPTFAEVQRRLEAARRQGKPYHLVHFDGHGGYSPAERTGHLCFENEDADADRVAGAAFGALLAKHQVSIALLEACRTADLSDVVSGSVAPELLRAGVGSVIAFSHAVTLTGARVFVKAFYEALCEGNTVGGALLAGRVAMANDPVRRRLRDQTEATLEDWHIVQLYQTGADPVLVEQANLPKPAETVSPTHVLGDGADLTPMYGFQGRSGDLLDLERRLRRYRAVLVSGMGGMGKTSLALEAGRWWTRTRQRQDGAVFTSFEPRPSVEQVIRLFGRALEGEGFLQLSDAEQRSRAIRLFREKEVLWIWDNFESMLPQFQPGEDSQSGEDTFEAVTDEDRRRLQAFFADLVKPNPEAPKGWIVVTCRPWDEHLTPIVDLELKGLSPGDALEMTRQVLAKRGVDTQKPGYERERIEQLLRALDCHPLSIELVAPHLREHTPEAVLSDFRRLVETFENKGAQEGRNRSLLASLRFSVDRLGPDVKAVLPYLAWFEGGAFEDVILDFVQLPPRKWAEVRKKLESVALVRVDDSVSVNDRPFVGFHPTLAYAANPKDVINPEEAEKRFVEVYSALARSVYEVLFGKQPAIGMKVMAVEDRNVRAATGKALRLGKFAEARVLTEVVRVVLTVGGGTADRARWAAWTQSRMVAATQGPARWMGERERAWGLCFEGRLEEASNLLENQLQAIEASGGDGRQKALCWNYLGQIWAEARQPQRALAPLQAAIDGFGACGDRANLSVALGNQSISLTDLGRFADALKSAERAVAIDRELGNSRNEAAGLGRMAQILMEQHKFAEADAMYEQALLASRKAGDPGLEGTVLQHQGALLRKQGRHAIAVERYQSALQRFQAAGDRAQEMRTADLLGTAEQELGHFEAAAVWYDRAEKLAVSLNNEDQISVIAQNRGVLLKTRALGLHEGADRQALLNRAVASTEVSLTVKRKREDGVGVALSLFQLGILHRPLGNLDVAEKHLLEGLAISEHLHLPDVWEDYANLEEIADLRKNPTEAAKWRAKKETKLAELEKLAGPPQSFSAK